MAYSRLLRKYNSPKSREGMKAVVFYPDFTTNENQTTIGITKY